MRHWHKTEGYLLDQHWPSRRAFRIELFLGNSLRQLGPLKIRRPLPRRSPARYKLALSYRIGRSFRSRPLP